MRRQPEQRPDPGKEQQGALRRGRDVGTTLTELLVTIVVMGIVVAPVMTAVIGVVRSSSTNRGLSQVETVLNNAANLLNLAQPVCDYSSVAEQAAAPLGWPANSVTVEESHFIPGATPAVEGRWNPGACVGTVPDSLLVQMVSVTVRNPETGAQRSIQVVKSDI